VVLLMSIIKRTAWSFLVLFGLSILIFSIVMIIPGDPARMALGAKASEEAVARYREEHHLNDSVFEQYYHWINGIFHGDWGTSIYTKRQILDEIKEYGPISLELIFYSAILTVGLGLFLGIISARYKNRWPDIVIRVLSYIGIATPPFVVAIFLILIFGYWLPVMNTVGTRIGQGITVRSITGMITIDAILTGNWQAFWSGLSGLLPPAFALSLGSFMQEAKVTRSSMLDFESKDFILLAKSQGIPERKINNKYLLKPSAIPTVSIMGLDIATLFGNAFIVEQIFNWPGLSRYGLTAMLQKDLNAICAVVLCTGAFFVICNIIVDILILILDPRVRHAHSR
jgi:peptide/nickel transport system permease protein